MQLIVKMSKFQAGEIQTRAKGSGKDGGKGGAKIKIKSSTKSKSGGKAAKKKPGAARK